MKLKRKTIKKVIKYLIVVIIVLVLIYSIGNLFIMSKMKKENTKNIIIDGGIIDFNSLTLKQKIAQMITIRGDDEKDLDYVGLGVGGIFLDRQKTKEKYKDLIDKWQGASKIKLFVSTDLEGAWNPYKDIPFPDFSEIKNIVDESYGGRAFSGNKEEIQEKIEGYITGLQENVMGTCKHYPGRSMFTNLHDKKDKQTIGKEDLELFQTCIDNNVGAIMVSHQIADGEVNSDGKPSTVSKEVIDSLEDYPGLIVADEINMKGLKNFYLTKKRELYRDLINSGEEVILDFYLSPKKLYELLGQLEDDVENGLIDESKINRAVVRILEAKGYGIKV